MQGVTLAIFIFIRLSYPLICTMYVFCSKKTIFIYVILKTRNLAK